MASPLMKPLMRTRRDVRSSGSNCVSQGELRVGGMDAEKRPNSLLRRCFWNQSFFSMLNADFQGGGLWPYLHPSAVLLVTVLLIGVGGCDGAGADGDTNFPAEVATETLNTGAVNVDQIDRGQYGDIVEGTQTVLRDEDAYASFWERLHAAQSSVPERPGVDFQERVVIAVVLGQRSSGGYGVKIDAVMASEKGGQMKVQFTETVPGDNCYVTSALTSPYVLAIVEAQDVDITFEGTEETQPC